MSSGDRELLNVVVKNIIVVFFRGKDYFHLLVRSNVGGGSRRKLLPIFGRPCKIYCTHRIDIINIMRSKYIFRVYRVSRSLNIFIRMSESGLRIFLRNQSSYRSSTTVWPTGNKPNNILGRNSRVIQKYSG